MNSLNYTSDSGSESYVERKLRIETSPVEYFTDDYIDSLEHDLVELNEKWYASGLESYKNHAGDLLIASTLLQDQFKQLQDLKSRVAFLESERSVLFTDKLNKKLNVSEIEQLVTTQISRILENGEMIEQTVSFYLTKIRELESALEEQLIANGSLEVVNEEISEENSKLKNKKSKKDNKAVAKLLGERNSEFREELEKTIDRKYYDRYAKLLEKQKTKSDKKVFKLEARVRELEEQLKAA